MTQNIVIIGGARDFHAMDWYRTVQKKMPKDNVVLLTDLIGGEGYDIIIKDSDNIEKLFVIDNLLFKQQTFLGNIWRNIVKILVLPVQIYLLKQYAKNNPNTVYHAHPMYYMLLCWLSDLDFIGSPQGDEILVRPLKSRIYKFFAQKVLRAAKFIVVDSVNMKNGINKLSNVEAIIYQYGIDMVALKTYDTNYSLKTQITSIRGMLPLYRIHEILQSRNESGLNCGINFIYPYKEEGYYSIIKKDLMPDDNDFGRLSKDDMYELISKSFLVISIPESDSSPRSVYESIFLGSCVAVTYNLYIESLPRCMQERLFIVDLNDKCWLSKAIEYAKDIVKKPYIPSDEAIEMFDQDISIGKVIDKLYINKGN